MGAGNVVPRTLYVVLDKLSSSQPTTLMAETELLVPILQQAAGLQLQSEDFEEEKDLLSVPGIDPRYLSIPAGNIVIVPTELPRLLSSSNKTRN